MAQSPETAEQRSMPTGSIEMDHVDLSVRRHSWLLNWRAWQLCSPCLKFARLKRDACSRSGAKPQRILQILRNVTGLDLRQYKQDAYAVELDARMVIRRIDSVADYARFLQIRPEEVRILHEDSLINVTRFFRDPEFWYSLSTQVLPSLFQRSIA